MALKFVLNPQLADISGKDHVGYDVRATSLIPGGTLTPTVVNGEPVEFLFYHDGNATLYFGEGSNPLSDYGFGQEPMTLTLQGYGALAMDFAAGSGATQGYWALQSAPKTLRDFLIANVGNDINVTIDADALKPPQIDLTEPNKPRNTFYQKRNNIHIAKNQKSKAMMDPTLGTTPPGPDIDYEGPGGGDGGLPVAADAQFDASVLTVGQQAVWADLTGDYTAEDLTNGQNFFVKDFPRGRGVEFHTNNHTTFGRWRIAPTIGGGAIPSTYFIVMTMTDDDPPIGQDLQWFGGNDGAGDRGYYYSNSQDAIRTRIGFATLTGRSVFNEYEGTNGNPVTLSTIGINSLSELYLMAGRPYTNSHVAMGNFRGGQTDADFPMQGAIHEYLIYERELTDEEFDSVLDYLKAKWSL